MPRKNTRLLNGKPLIAWTIGAALESGVIDKLVVSTEDKEIAFNAGSHRELVKMLYKDFEKLVRPKIAKFSIEIK